jgi:orotidine-5'-phosphate decarboxylase
MYKKLDDRIVKVNSLVCVGLDPDIAKIPLSIIQSHTRPEDALYNFLTQVIDITAPYACCFKAQKAFYDIYPEGHNLLKNIIAYIHLHYPDVPVFIDCKIGDIDNTMNAYITTLFDIMKADAIVINPYMADDVLEPFMKDPTKAAIVLIKTSNPHAYKIQNLELANGKKLWQEILSITVNYWNSNHNIMIVLPSTNDMIDYTSMRQQIPEDMPILLTGIGAQGGNPMVIHQLLNKEKRGICVNASRSILYPYNRTNIQWKMAVEQAIISLRNTLNTIRYA